MSRYGVKTYIYIDQEEDPYPLLSNKEKGNVTHFQGCLEQFSILFMYSNSSFFFKKNQGGEREFFPHAEKNLDFLTCCIGSVQWGRGVVGVLG